jgi:Mg2+/Co2+ transporter CorC
MKEKIKKSILVTFETCMRELYGKIELEHVQDPRSWEQISKVAVIVDDYVKIKDIFTLIGIHTNKSQD